MFIGQNFISGFNGTKLNSVTKKLITKFNIGGVILFKRNIETLPQVLKLNQSLQKISKTPLIISVDQEGGRVARLKEPFMKIPPMQTFGKALEKTGDVRPIYEMARLLGKELKVLGFNCDFAPILDVHVNPKNPVIGDRAFSKNPLTVSLCAEAVISGLKKERVLSCGKHFPGHGGTSADSHLELPIERRAAAALKKIDLYPYQYLIKKNLLPSIMTAHVIYPAFDPQNCATLSKAILTDLLRKKMKYQGLIISDDFFMKAIAGESVGDSSVMASGTSQQVMTHKSADGIKEAVLKFFEAGGDIALMCHEPEVQMDVMSFIFAQAKKSKSLQKHLERSQKKIQRMKKYYVSQ